MKKDNDKSPIKEWLNNLIEDLAPIVNTLYEHSLHIGVGVIVNLAKLYIQNKIVNNIDNQFYIKTALYSTTVMTGAYIGYKMILVGDNNNELTEIDANN